MIGLCLIQRDILLHLPLPSGSIRALNLFGVAVWSVVRVLLDNARQRCDAALARLRQVTHSLALR